MLSLFEISDITSHKNELRAGCLSAPGQPAPTSLGKLMGKVSERLRHLPSYRAAQSVMISPSPLLLQTRLNAVTDRKRLVIPSPGLHKGFVAVAPQFIPPKQRHSAVQASPENPFATRMRYQESPSFPIDMIVTESLMVGLDGGRLGDGSGHLDLQYAILSSLGWISSTLEIVTLVDSNRVVPCLPMKPTDVGIHWILTADSTIRTPLAVPAQAGIQWEGLSIKQIRRNDALFFLHRTAT